MANELTWSLNPREFIKNVEIAVKDAAIDLANTVYEGVVDRSPVFTGNFRASWNLTHSVEDLTIKTGGAPDSILPAPQTPKLVGVPKYPKLFIVNAQPYAIRLEYGWSQQAPSGIVGVTIGSLK